MKNQLFSFYFIFQFYANIHLFLKRFFVRLKSEFIKGNQTLPAGEPRSNRSNHPFSENNGPRDEFVKFHIDETDMDGYRVKTLQNDRSLFVCFFSFGFVDRRANVHFSVTKETRRHFRLTLTVRKNGEADGEENFRDPERY